MADEENQTEVSQSAGNTRMVTLMIVGGLMIVEGAAVFAVTRLLAPEPATATAAGKDGATDDADGSSLSDRAEVVLSECRPTNKMSGKLITFSVKVFALVPREQLEDLEKRVADMQARIDDRVNYVFRSAEMAHLNEPERQTIKRRLKREFEALFGEDAGIQEILIPEMLQSGGGV